MEKVIDISYHNGNIDFKKVKQAGITKAIIRCGFGDNIPTQHDKKFRDYMTVAIAEGFEIALYVYSYASTPAQAESEARHIIDSYNKYKYYDKLSRVLFIDIEEAHLQKYAALVLYHFDRYIVSQGFKTGLYTGEYYYKNIVGEIIYKNITDYVLWLAKYGTNNGDIPTNKPSYECDLWQYTSKGKVDGISGYVDLSIIHTTKIFGEGATKLDIDTAIKVLHKKGVISTTNYWYNAVKVVKYLDQLLINAAEVIK